MTHFAQHKRAHRGRMSADFTSPSPDYVVVVTPVAQHMRGHAGFQKTALLLGTIGSGRAGNPRSRPDDLIDGGVFVLPANSGQGQSTAGGTGRVVVRRS